MVGHTPSDETGRRDQTGGGPTARRIILGAQLRRLREAAGITRAAAGYAIRGSESKISRLELGRVGFKSRDVADLLTLYGVTEPAERDAVMAMVLRSNERGWWHRYSDLMPAWFQDYVGLEESAARIMAYEAQFVPGLLQTKEYCLAVASHGRPDVASQEVQRRVALRMQRQRVLHRPGAPKFWVVIDESVLRRPIGGRNVMLHQLDHLLEITRLPHVVLQVVPYQLSGYAAEGSFAMLRFAEPELPDVVYIEHLTGALYLDRLDELERYGRVFDRLTVDAEPPESSRALLAKLRAEI
ncbi:helix-turn-helix transcriptional regulator [Actinophytocola sp.]|uniref:helix-turn-helix domain-containing protein n=1 Tax=Actinophytocola sp. TaxID=1872138 RepID=UPI002D7EE7E1|nr:helix-turn-helix transcriptional regulator [Actinophytocola sp.]HET9142056.1 helix-turn-helix transcriptional regulator [Actinophytocola sp.]HEU5110271.1 helix-turn-helix transcriptional regulator [Micromonosporaceae bacterium]